MRSLSIRGLVVLLSLALASWNVHALGHGDLAPAAHCLGAGVQAPSGSHHDHAPGPTKAGCRCDYLACASAAIVAPAMTIGSADYSDLRYDLADAGPLSVRAHVLDPDPPRPAALI